MHLSQFPNPKLVLPNEIRDSTDFDSFQVVENYLVFMSEYIYTDINLNHGAGSPNPSSEKHVHSWVLRIVSANLFRSLYIRNSFVETFNARNYVGIYFSLKAWLEVVGVMAYILDLLDSNLTTNQLHTALEPFALGNRGKGSLRVGIIDSKSVQTMIEKADRLIKKMQKDEGITELENNIFTEFYDIASNPSHPSYDALDIIGEMDRNQTIWKIKSPEKIKALFVSEIGLYRGLLTSVYFLEIFCKKIFEIEKDVFLSFNSKKYFDTL